MQLTTTGYLEAVGRIGLFHTKRYIGVQFTEQSVTQVTAGNELTFLTGKGRVIYHELHGNGRLTDLLERNGYYIFGRADGVTDVELTDTGDCNDGTDACFLDFYFIQTIELVQLADFGLDDLVGVVVVTDDHILVHTDGTVVYLTDTDTTYIFIIINGTDQYLGSSIRISFGSGNVVNDRLEQRLHIGTHFICIQGSDTCFGGSVYERTV